MNFLNELDEEILEEFVYEYEDGIEEIDVDELISRLKSDISDYVYDIPMDEVPEMDFEEIDYDFVDECRISDEELERLEPKEDIPEFLEK